MSLIGFQKALYSMISNPNFCIQVRQNNATVLEKLDLSPKEKKRLIAIARQKGMNTNCTLYRINRVTPLYTMMPYTCKLLNDQLLAVLSGFWQLHPRTNLQFKDEVHLFYTYIKEKLDSNEIKKHYLKETLELEGKMNELRFNEDYSVENRNNSANFQLSPHIKVVQFSYNPNQLFQYLTTETLHQTTKIDEGTYFLMIENKNQELLMKVITNDLGNILLNIENFNEVPDDFLELGLVKKIETI